jgi:hypothetical protein
VDKDVADIFSTIKTCTINNVTAKNKAFTPHNTQNTKCELLQIAMHNTRNVKTSPENNSHLQQHNKKVKKI